MQCGARTNYRGITDLLDDDLFGTERVAVVRDVWDRSGDRLWLVRIYYHTPSLTHLLPHSLTLSINQQNKVFAVLDNKTVAIKASVLAKGNNHRRMVDEWTRQADGKYVVTVEAADFEDYLISLGFTIIPVPDAEDDSLCHLLNLGGGRILSTSSYLAQVLQDSPHFSGSVSVAPMHSGFQSMSMVQFIHCISFYCIFYQNKFSFSILILLID